MLARIIVQGLTTNLARLIVEDNPLELIVNENECEAGFFLYSEENQKISFIVCGEPDNIVRLYEHLQKFYMDVEIQDGIIPRRWRNSHV